MSPVSGRLPRWRMISASTLLSGPVSSDPQPIDDVAASSAAPIAILFIWFLTAASSKRVLASLYKPRANVNCCHLEGLRAGAIGRQPPTRRGLGATAHNG